MLRKIVTLFIFIFLFNLASGAPVSLDSAKADSIQPKKIPADSSALLFLNKCAGCHTIGLGKITGPDLLPVQIWPLTDLLPKIKAMEKNVGPLGEPEIAVLSNLLKDDKARERLKAEEDRKMAALIAKMEPASPQKGQALFTGLHNFQNRGPACAACHSVGGDGGTFGPDLTRLASRMGHAAILSACEKAAFNVMEPIYRTHPVTTQEAMHLAAFFEAANAQPQGSRPKRKLLPLSLAGVGLVYVSLGFYYRKRHRPGETLKGKRN